MIGFSSPVNRVNPVHTFWKDNIVRETVGRLHKEFFETAESEARELNLHQGFRLLDRINRINRIHMIVFQILSIV